MWWFGLAVFLNVLQLYFATKVAASASAVAKVNDMAQPPNFDLKYFCSKLEESTFWPMRFFLKKANAKTVDGDYAAVFMRFASFAQIQGLLVLGQMGSLIFVLWILAKAISV